MDEGSFRTKLSRHQIQRNLEHNSLVKICHDSSEISECIPFTGGGTFNFFSLRRKGINSRSNSKKKQEEIPNNFDKNLPKSPERIKSPTIRNNSKSNQLRFSSEFTRPATSLGISREIKSKSLHSSISSFRALGQTEEFSNKGSDTSPKMEKTYVELPDRIIIELKQNLENKLQMTQRFLDKITMKNVISPPKVPKKHQNSYQKKIFQNREFMRKRILSSMKGDDKHIAYNFTSKVKKTQNFRKIDNYDLINPLQHSCPATSKLYQQLLKEPLSGW